MLDVRPSTVVEDSQGNKYFFYYMDSSIYYREVTSTGEIKDTILISQVGSDFAAAVDVDDTLYLACNSRYKGIMLFVYTNYGWKFEYVINAYNVSSIYLIDILIANSSIHIFYSKKLPLPNMYNVYHMSKRLNEPSPYVEYAWRKNSLSEIYALSLEYSFSLLLSKGGLIHFAGVWNDGTQYFINYHCYDDSIKAWMHKSLSMSYKNGVNIKLLYYNKKLNLFCFSTDSDGNNLHHFISKPSGGNDIGFKHLYSTKIDSDGTMPSFYADEKSIRMEWLKDSIYWQYAFEEGSNKWKKTIELPQTADTDMLYMKIIKNKSTASYPFKGYYLLDRSYHITKPMEHMSKSSQGGKTAEKAVINPPNDTTDYLKQILNEIMSLSDNVKYLSRRVESLESKSSSLKTGMEESSEPPVSVSSRPQEYPTFKKSGFKERFMKSTTDPDFKSLLMNQDNISISAGIPDDDTRKSEESIKENKPSTEAIKNENRTFTESAANTVKETEIIETNKNKTDYKHSSLLEKIGEFFK